MTTRRRITVPLTDDELQSLRESAQKDLRNAKDQARWLLRQALGLDEQSGAAETATEG